MRWPPLLLHIKFIKRNRGFGLWLPLFLIGPLFTLFLLAIIVIVLPFIVLALLVAALAIVFEWQTQWWKSCIRQARWAGYSLKAFPAFLQLLGTLPGLKIDVQGKKEQILISIY